MHSYDRTLLSSLGFSDPDKSNRLHDLACQYLASPEAAIRIFNLVGGIPKKVSVHQRQYKEGSCVIEWNEVTSISRGDPSISHRFERPVIKGEDKYRSVVGFVDLALYLAVLYQFDNSTRSINSTDYIFEEMRQVSCFVEVKISPVNSGDILRQIALYDQFVGNVNWVVATRFPLASGDLASLRNQGIQHIRLAFGFDQFVAEQNAEKGSSDSIEF